MQKVWLILCIIIIFGFISGCFQKSTVRLEYKYEVGDILKHNICVNNTYNLDIYLPDTILTNISGISTEKNIIHENKKNYTVSTYLEVLCTKRIKDVRYNHIIVIEEIFEPLKEEILINKESIILEGCSFSEILKDKILTLEITKDGSIKEINGIKEILNKIYEVTNLLNLDCIARARIRDIFKQGIDQIIQQSILMFPDEEVKKGDIWQREAIVILPIIRVKSTITHRNILKEFEVVDNYECVKLVGSITCAISEDKHLRLSELIGDDIVNKLLQLDIHTDMDVYGGGNGSTITYFAHVKGRMVRTDISQERFVRVTGTLTKDGKAISKDNIVARLTMNTRYTIKAMKI
jgi:hypothetical protein